MGVVGTVRLLAELKLPSISLDQSQGLCLFKERCLFTGKQTCEHDVLSCLKVTAFSMTIDTVCLPPALWSNKVSQINFREQVSSERSIEIR
jgi:hypothetical protein